MFECWAAWNVSATITTLWASAATAVNYASETIVVLGTPNAGANFPQRWDIVGQCPNKWVEVISVSGGNINWNGAATALTTTWWVTIDAYCQPQGAQFAFFTRWEWEPPELPLIWLLRGGTNTLAPLEPLYIKAWNEYVSAWLYENGFMFDLLVLLALIMPILVRPATRRLRLT